MLELLSVLNLTAHLLAMNLATAGPLLAAVMHWRRPADATTLSLTLRLSRGSAIALMIGVAIGVGQLILAWQDHGPLLKQAFDLLPQRRYWFGGTEIVFSWGCLFWYRRAITRRLSNSESSSGWWGLLPFAAGTNLAYHFPPLFTILGVYGTRPDTWGKPLSFVAALGDPEVLGHWLHFLLASTTVAGLALAWCALKANQTAELTHRGTLAGGRIALAATVLQLVSGLHLLSVVDERARDALLGGDLVGTIGFAAALVATVVLLHRLASIALAETSLAELKGTLLTLTLVVLCMVSSLQASRRVIQRQVSFERYVFHEKGQETRSAANANSIMD
jgi:hypothetical protein